MAATVSLSFSLDPQHNYISHNPHFKHHKTFPLTPSFPISLKHPYLLPHRYNRYASKSSSSSSHSTPSAATNLSYSEDPFRTGRFLSNEELEKLKLLENFRYGQELESGSLWVRVMRAEEMDAIVALLAESFAESMLWPSGYLSLLRYLVKQYLIERRALMPHTATLIGFYRGKENGVLEQEEEEEQLAGTVEVCFDKRGANASPPTPTAPKNSPYISNMTVKSSLRRRGIGWHLLKASEELISQMSSSGEVYLHCRMIDVAPFNMYTKAGYSVVKTDSILILLMLQRRKHLMCKELPAIRIPSDMSDSVEE
ncbi:GCN5-related N-acetyltransferase 5, chloroplastic [Corylus avellana]|uniref:GCN5-related N-acetyltransferase 5, chloroplastic n=1 Tax=Corylus avellana TaxID=13451 RepID=UPI00286A44B1|nr:GCN5-related N-acetyltransferase 5, chloroplastic [Corylus avellana]